MAWVDPGKWFCFQFLAIFSDFLIFQIPMPENEIYIKVLFLMLNIYASLNMSSLYIYLCFISVFVCFLMPVCAFVSQCF